MSHPLTSDKELVMRLAKSDESAFRELYIHYKEKLWRYAFSFLKSEEETDDLIQEIFIRVWELRFFMDPELSFSSFLYTMTRNRILNYFRNMDVEQQLKKALALRITVETEASESDLIFSDYQAILINAIEQLPPQRQRIFNLSRIEQKSHKEIAVQLGISVSTVQEHISESLRFIKRYFSKHTDITLGVFTLAVLY
jgi:RNA polymerase sigma-70 factor (ECF subfamily)